MINLKRYEKDSPEWVLAKFLESWKRRAWKKMADYIQLSWLDIYTEPEKRLKSRFSPKLIDANLIQVNARTGIVTDFLIELDISQKVVSKIRLICEEAPMKPSPQGKWGVNPSSIILEAEFIPEKKITLADAMTKTEESPESEDKTEKTEEKVGKKSRSKK